MTDTSGTTPPFSGFPCAGGFAPAEMLERMWNMMRLSPFGSAFAGAQPGGGLAPSLSMMSDMMAPLTNVEELDKRITDMRAVEQWLKLNLSMLQSAIQALEVQRATLATLRAFGAFAQSSMAQPAAAPSPSPASGWPHTGGAGSEGGAGSSFRGDGDADKDESETPATPPFDASAWWNLLQSQFNQIAQFAMTQPAMAAAAAGGTASNATSGESTATDAAATSTADDTTEHRTTETDEDPGAASKRAATKRAAASAKRTGSTGASTRAGKKSI